MPAPSAVSRPPYPAHRATARTAWPGTRRMGMGWVMLDASSSALSAGRRRRPQTLASGAAFGVSAWDRDKTSTGWCDGRGRVAVSGRSDVRASGYRRGMSSYGIPISRETLCACAGCGVTVTYREEGGRKGGHCPSCSRIARQGRRYNLTASDVIAILDFQGGVCALCGSGPQGQSTVSYWHIDHDHKCCWPSDAAWAIGGGCVRGLLCNGCNSRGVAWYEDLPEDRMDWQRMNDYLSDPPARRLNAAGRLKFLISDFALDCEERRRLELS
ncbi:endonuclease domain-containing protein [Streptomyces sp. NPDC057682]|uniref:endonuclease domain-containing protein n=1 Tax=Streptomyces sp. NPDC057682 TaxID=3346210 RepID=UPI00368BC1B6